MPSKCNGKGGIRGVIMGTARKPIHRKGERNALCPHYAICLDEAVNGTWAYWDCSECECQSSRDPRLDIQNRINDSMPYYDLPDGIFEKVC